MNFTLLTMLLLVPPTQTDHRAFATLRAAYAARDAGAAAGAYADSAEVIYRYAGAPEERHRGRTAIRASFAALFAQIDTAQAMDLNFRVTRRRGRSMAGLYRIRIGTSQQLYGRFDVTLDGAGRFVRDVSTDATAAEFERSRAPLLFTTRGSRTARRARGVKSRGATTSDAVPTASATRAARHPRTAVAAATPCADRLTSPRAHAADRPRTWPAAAAPARHRNRSRALRS